MLMEANSPDLREGVRLQEAEDFDLLYYLK